MANASRPHAPLIISTPKNYPLYSNIYVEIFLFMGTIQEWALARNTAYSDYSAKCKI